MADAQKQSKAKKQRKWRQKKKAKLIPEKTLPVEERQDDRDVGFEFGANVEAEDPREEVADQGEVVREERPAEEENSGEDELIEEYEYGEDEIIHEEEEVIEDQLGEEEADEEEEVEVADEEEGPGFSPIRPVRAHHVRFQAVEEFLVEDTGEHQRRGRRESFGSAPFLPDSDEDSATISEDKQADRSFRARSIDELHEATKEFTVTKECPSSTLEEELRFVENG